MLFWFSYVDVGMLHWTTLYCVWLFVMFFFNYLYLFKHMMKQMRYTRTKNMYKLLKMFAAFKLLMEFEHLILLILEHLSLSFHSMKVWSFLLLKDILSLISCWNPKSISQRKLQAIIYFARLKPDVFKLHQNQLSFGDDIDMLLIPNPFIPWSLVFFPLNYYFRRSLLLGILFCLYFASLPVSAWPLSLNQ